MDAREVAEQLRSNFPCRKRQIEDILLHVGGPFDRMPPLFLCGPSGTGKTAVIRAALARMRRPHVYLPLTSACGSPQSVYHAVLTQLAQQQQQEEQQREQQGEQPSERTRVLPAMPASFPSTIPNRAVFLRSLLRVLSGDAAEGEGEDAEAEGHDDESEEEERDERDGREGGESDQEGEERRKRCKGADGAVCVGGEGKKRGENVIAWEGDEERRITRGMLRSRLAATPVAANPMTATARAAHQGTDSDRSRSGNEQSSEGHEEAARECALQHEGTVLPNKRAALQPPASPRHAKRPTVHAQAEAGGASGERERGRASGLWFVMNGGGQAGAVGPPDEMEEGEVRSEDGEEEGEEAGFEMEGEERGGEMDGQKDGGEEVENAGYEEDDDVIEVGPVVIETQAVQQQEEQMEQKMLRDVQVQGQRSGSREKHKGGGMGRGGGGGAGGGPTHPSARRSLAAAFAGAEGTEGADDGRKQGVLERGSAFMGPGPQCSPLAAVDKEPQVCLVKPRIDATMYLVIDNLEQLKAFPAGEGPQLLETFLRLPELLGQSNLGLILVSKLDWASTCGLGAAGMGTGGIWGGGWGGGGGGGGAAAAAVMAVAACEPVTVFFPSYNDKELETVLVGMRPNQPLFLSFLRQVVPVYSRACRSLPHLASLVDHSWPLYTAPITSGSVPPDHPSCARLLYMRAQEHIGGTLKQPVSTLVRSSVMDSAAAAAATSAAANSPFHGMYLLQCTQRQQQQQQQQMRLGWGLEAPVDGPDLPIMARFALVAAFTCSRNPAPSDLTLFNFSDSAHPGGAGFRSRRKRKASAADLDKQAREAREAQQQGPIPFPLSRWLLMAHHLVKAHWSSPLALVSSGAAAESAPAVDDSLLTQLATLIRGGLVSQSGEDRLASTTRFKCSARKELVKQVANTLGIRLEQLLLFG